MYTHTRGHRSRFEMQRRLWLETKRDGSDRDAEVNYTIDYRIDLLAAPLRHLAINRQQRLVSEMSDERVTRLQRDRDSHNN